MESTGVSLSSFNMDQSPGAVTHTQTRSARLRNLTAFWILGLTNNFAYVVMLTAAHDILKEEEGNTEPFFNISTIAPETTTTTSNSTVAPGPQYLSCNAISTGAILLADILPTLLIKLTAPFYIQRVPYRLKVILVILFALVSFLIVAFAHQVWLSIIGVVFASCCGGLGEITFLSLTSFYDSKVVSAWSSGTGAAGVFGALGYAGLTSAGLSARNTVLSLVVVPVLMGVSYFFVLTKPNINITVTVDSPTSEDVGRDSDTNLVLTEDMRKEVKLTLQQKLHLVPPLLKYMIPLTTVYFAEYFINQGLHELLYFNNLSWLDKSAQYRWYQVDYQIGVFISRSAVTCLPVPTKWLWILPALQLGNMALLICEVFYRFIPSFWVIVVIVLWEGLLGGSAYVNTFYKIRQEVEPEFCEFSLGVASVGDTVGIAVAGAVAIPSHNHICTQRIKMRY